MLSFIPELWNKGVTTHDHIEMMSGHSIVWLDSRPDGICGQ